MDTKNIKTALQECSPLIYTAIQSLDHFTAQPDDDYEQRMSWLETMLSELDGVRSTLESIIEDASQEISRLEDLSYEQQDDE